MLYFIVQGRSSERLFLFLKLFFVKNVSTLKYLLYLHITLIKTL